MGTGQIFAVMHFLDEAEKEEKKAKKKKKKAKKKRKQRELEEMKRYSKMYPDDPESWLDEWAISRFGNRIADNRQAICPLPARRHG